MPLWLLSCTIYFSSLLFWMPLSKHPFYFRMLYGIQCVLYCISHFQKCKRRYYFVPGSWKILLFISTIQLYKNTHTHTTFEFAHPLFLLALCAVVSSRFMLCYYHYNRRWSRLTVIFFLLVVLQQIDISIQSVCVCVFMFQTLFAEFDMNWI